MPACPFAGDSRAVIQRGEATVELTSDHKPAREDEAVGANLRPHLLDATLACWAGEGSRAHPAAVLAG